MKTVYLHILGCPKNETDAEICAGFLSGQGYTFCSRPEDAAIIIIMSCTFIESAKKETIDAVFSMLDFKKFGSCSKLVLAGCMPQRYQDEIAGLFPEVDAFIGTENLGEIIQAVSGHGSWLQSPPVRYTEYNIKRPVPLSRHFAYIKIAEGCSSRCSYCSIPHFKGNYRSRRIEAVVNEAQQLSADGTIKEIILIAQDTAVYGLDLYGRKMLPELLAGLSAIDTISWIRIMYMNPFHLDDEILAAMAAHEKICRYIDIPFQHFSDKILKLMNRPQTMGGSLALVEKIRSYMPDAALRTSLIAGFPGETDKDFAEMLAAVEKIRFNRLGIFGWSGEENTPAFDLPYRLSGEIIRGRIQEIMETQVQISTELLEKQVGNTFSVLVEKNRKIRRPDGAYLEYVGRSRYEAPEIDGVFYIKTGSLEVSPGNFISACVDHSNEHDLFGTVA